MLAEKVNKLMFSACWFWAAWNSYPKEMGSQNTATQSIRFHESKLWRIKKPNEHGLVWRVEEGAHY